MNRILAASIALAAAAFAGAAAADDITIDNAPFASARSRADVQAELQQYRQAGVNPWSTSYNPLRSFAGASTRAQITADFAASRSQAAALTGEDSGSQWLSTHGAPATSKVLAGQPVNAQ